MHWIGDFDRTSPLTWLTLAAGAVLLLAAWRMDAAWFDAHILPDFFYSRHSQWTVTAAARLGLALAGLLTILVARPLLVRRMQGVGLFQVCLIMGGIVIAAAAAVVSTELVLRTQQWRFFQARNMHDEPRRQADVRLGWTHIAHHAGRDVIGGRRVAYAFDSHGYRVRGPGAETDHAAPSIVFIGESVMLGYGLAWDETIPARVGAALGMQSVNLAVTGYSTDQAFMRLRTDLPRFGCPLGVVSIFMPGFLDRNLNTDRPRLDAALRWHEPNIGWRLAVLGRHALRYRGKGSVDEGVAMTSAVLRATRTMARSRGARSLIVVPTFMPENRAQRTIRRRVLDDEGLDYVMVPLDPKSHLAGDRHPDRRAAAQIASAIVSRLRYDGMTLNQSAAPAPERRASPCSASREGRVPPYGT